MSGTYNGGNLIEQLNVFGPQNLEIENNRGVISLCYFCLFFFKFVIYLPKVKRRVGSYIVFYIFFSFFFVKVF